MAHHLGALTWNANGTLASLNITDAFNSANVQNCNYAHDDLARIASVNCGTGKWNQTFSYDPYGNISKSTTGPGVSFQPTYSAASNRISSLAGTTPTYDGNGNLTSINLGTVQTYQWNADSRPTQIDSVGITYDALGRIVEQNRSGTYTQIVYSPTGEKRYLMNGQWLQRAFVPLPGGATAVYGVAGFPPTGVPQYYRHSDWLGSSRLASTPNRTVFFDGAYAPFGEDYAKSGTTDLDFTGQNQDTVAGLYDFLFREYSPVQGRWISPDPLGLGAANLTNPQSWNRYAYVLNSPLSLVDPLGLLPCDPQDLSPEYCNPFEVPNDIPVRKLWKFTVCMFDEMRGSVDAFCLPIEFGPIAEHMRGSMGTDPCSGLPTLVPLDPTQSNFTTQPNPQTPIRLLFTPEVVGALTRAFQGMNDAGVVPVISSGGGFRTAVDQLHMQRGGSGSNPAARISWHQAGAAVDISGTRLRSFPTVISNMQAQGFTWGGTFSRPDPPHFDARSFMGDRNTAVSNAQNFFSNCVQ